MRDKDELIENIIHLQERMNRLVMAYKIENWLKIGLTIDQLKSLIIIQGKGKASFKDLAEALGISRSNITGIADRLVQSGLITRNQNSADRRVQYLILTEKGKEILDNIKQEIIDDITRLLQNLEI